MSSIPGYKLEDFVAWQWNLVVDEAPENNISLGFAEALGNIPERPRLTKEQFAPILAVYEPLRETIERRLDDFDEDKQSWRGYASYVDCDMTDEMNAEAERLVKELKCALLTVQSS
ncbi:hypothetical protein D3C73_173550 [compost metagenome]